MGCVHGHVMAYLLQRPLRMTFSILDILLPLGCGSGKPFAEPIFSASSMRLPANESDEDLQCQEAQLCSNILRFRRIHSPSTLGPITCMHRSGPRITTDGVHYHVRGMIVVAAVSKVWFSACASQLIRAAPAASL